VRLLTGRQVHCDGPDRPSFAGLGGLDHHIAIPPVAR
jgi:hypothetical protein